MWELVGGQGFGGARGRHLRRQQRRLLCQPGGSPDGARRPRGAQARNQQEDPAGWACGRPDPQALQGQQSLGVGDGDGDIGGAFPDDIMLVCLVGPQRDTAGAGVQQTDTISSTWETLLVLLMKLSRYARMIEWGHV